ncbi:hypothetical protein B0T26DRAFT_711635 [Lasiosphaeria miniovina]|uniref:Secreted protein n=1 Tax=Lasiosphaeria miniovina TaxID=1954250 RepID=A0AA40DY80_9PEZI|nr:uncharacterized protein B0T26DRAFT_711635 [Lasiosphaeria miniovina]KAK0718042.1 hypothetical protein B0T26DRAFT_711635 [Lasiosphaeria miniovina]
MSLTINLFFFCVLPSPFPAPNTSSSPCNMADASRHASKQRSPARCLSSPSRVRGRVSGVIFRNWFGSEPLPPLWDLVVW